MGATLHLMKALVVLALCGCHDSSSATPDGSVAITDTAISDAAIAVSLATPVKKQIFLEMVNTAEQSALDWTTAYPYCEDIGDGRGYTTGIAGFTTDSAGATTDDGPGVLGVVLYYNGVAPNNVLQKYTTALQMVATAGTGSHTKIDAVGAFCTDWSSAAADPLFKNAQQHDFDVTAFDPARELAQQDGLSVLGQALYVDDSILNGYGGNPSLVHDVAAAKAMAMTPAQGGDEKAYLTAFVAAYRASIEADPGHAGDGSVGRADTMWGPLVSAGNLDLHTPLHWAMYDQPFEIDADPVPDAALATDW
jgi:chitosanase